ncbi:tyrosine-type recombinase/integrase, partial [Acetobacter indonesiensis]
MAHGLGRHDPASVIKGALAPLIKGRQPALIDMEELKCLFHQVELIPAHPVTMLALRFLALTVVRPGEVHAIGWHELSEDKSFWIIPAERMKIRREHVVPLSRQAQEILQAVSVLTGKGPLADLPDETEEVIGDRGYDSNRIRLSLAERNITACILPRKNRKSKPPYNWNLYKKRHLIENMFAKLKDWRRVA